ncbi:MAG: lamin tail domain-containing protein [Planctomycetes bacterium]|nr:lamin tail domain-containing protein [Planctomycetota bacterium]
MFCSPLSAAPWIAITEIHYHPPQGEALEFVEIYSREPPRADLGGWRLEGEVEFEFPPGTILFPGEYLVIARDPLSLSRTYPDAKRLIGPFAGRLDNKGGALRLLNAAGAVACEVRYDAGGKWPATPDGTGHTLSLIDPHFDPRRPENWTASPLLGGTPGRENGFHRDGEGKLLVKGGERWAFFRGKAAPPVGWKDLSFNDSSWESGATPMGFGDSPKGTEIADMRGQYLSLFLRKVFEVESPETLSQLVLRVDYDDGFAVWLNGEEAARANLGPLGAAVAFDQRALGLHESGVASEYGLGQAAKRLRRGKNILAVEVHNIETASSDLHIQVELESKKAGASGTEPGGSVPAARGLVAGQAEPRINEVFLSDPAPLEGGARADSFIEIFNPYLQPLALGGYYLNDDPANLKKFQLPAALALKPRGFAAVGAAELGAAFQLKGPELLIALTRPDGQRVVDALRLRWKDAGAPAGAAPPAQGRFPDGAADLAILAAPTPAAPNSCDPTGPLVINEIMFHPITGLVDDEFVEIYNRSKQHVPLRGYRFSEGVEYRFKDNEAIEPEGYLVVARDPAALQKKYGLSARQATGPYQGTLSDRGEVLTLLDPKGNVADRVEYGDRFPWPQWADGLGASLELIHPDLDNSFPGAWAASDDRSKSSWQVFQYAKEHKAFKNRSISELQIFLLNEGECLIDDIHFLSGKELIADGSFDRGGAGWRPLGTHEGSGAAVEEGKKVYRLVAEGGGDPRFNYVALSLPEGLAPGKKYTVAFRARWLRGSQLLMTRTGGQGVAQVHRLKVPARLGTPGAANSRRAKEPPPIVGIPRQSPALPTAEEPVTIQVPISTPARTIASIHYRRDAKEGSSGWFDAPLHPLEVSEEEAASAEASVWIGQIPPLPPGIIEFYISARDAKGKEGAYPPDAPKRTALYAVGLIPNRKFPSYALLASEREWSAMMDRPSLSNRLADATFVYGDSRLFYNVGFRRRGSPFQRDRNFFNWRIVFGEETLDGRQTLNLDGQGGDGTQLQERLTYWLLDSLRAPHARDQYVHFRLYGHQEGIFEDVERIDGRFLDRWFAGRPAGEEKGNSAASAVPGKPLAKPAEKGANKSAGQSTDKSPGGSSARHPAEAENPGHGLLHKIDDYFEFFPEGGQDYVEAFMDFKSSDPEDYRWNFPPASNGNDENFEPLIKLIHLMDPVTTPDQVFLERVESMVDVDEWLKVLAARSIAHDWDSFGQERGKNSYLYQSLEDQRWRLLPWDCDLSWRNPQAPIFSMKFKNIRRLEQIPAYRRQYLGYLGYLAKRLASPPFEEVLKDLHQRTGAGIDWFRNFARIRESFVFKQIPDYAFAVKTVKRVAQTGEPDLLQAAGSAPILAQRFRLDGREGARRFEGESRWMAEFPVGPEGGEAVIEALDFGGGEVARAAIKVPARPGAQPLPVKQVPEPITLVSSVEEKIAEPPRSPLPAPLPPPPPAPPSPPAPKSPPPAAPQPAQPAEKPPEAAKPAEPDQPPPRVEAVAEKPPEESAGRTFASRPKRVKPARRPAPAGEPPPQAEIPPPPADLPPEGISWWVVLLPVLGGLGLLQIIILKKITGRSTARRSRG